MKFGEIIFFLKNKVLLYSFFFFFTPNQIPLASLSLDNGGQDFLDSEDLQGQFLAMKWYELPFPRL